MYPAQRSRLCRNTRRGLVAWARGIVLAVFALAVTAAPAKADLRGQDLLKAGDQLLTRDDATGLEWLDLSVSVGFFDGFTTYDSVSGLLAVGGPLEGFRYASEEEISALWSHAGIVNQSQSEPSAMQGESIGQLLRLMGQTGGPSMDRVGANAFATGINGTLHGSIARNHRVSVLTYCRACGAGGATLATAVLFEGAKYDGDAENDLTGTTGGIHIGHWLVRRTTTATVPSPPTNVTVTRINQQQVRIDWVGVTGADGYIVKRGTGPGREVPFETVVGATSKVLFAMLGTQYYVVVSSAARGQESVNSAEVTFRLDPYAIPSNAIHPLDWITPGDERITRDDITGLEWLDPFAPHDFHPMGTTYNEVFADLAPGGPLHGFRYATEDEVSALWNHAGIYDQAQEVDSAAQATQVAALMRMLGTGTFPGVHFGSNSQLTFINGTPEPESPITQRYGYPAHRISHLGFCGGCQSGSDIAVAVLRESSTSDVCIQPDSGPTGGCSGNRYGHYLVRGTPPVAPSAPANVTATLVGQAQVRLAWTSVPGAESYIVKSGSYAGAASVQVAVENGTNMLATGKPGAEYHFTVTSVANGLESGATNDVSIRLPPGPMTPPVRVVVTRFGSRKVRLDWSAVDGAEGYKVKRRTTAGSETLFTTTSALSVLIDAEIGDQFSFRVSAYNGSGESVDSLATTITVTPAAVRGDVDADRKSDILIYRPADGYWYSRNSRSGYEIGSGDWAVQWGKTGDIPIQGDFDGDGKTDPTVYRPGTSQWFIRYSSRNYDRAQYGYVQVGAPGDTPIAADFDGDGTTDLGVYRPTTGYWYLRVSSRNYEPVDSWVFQWGTPGDVPVLGDFDGDGKADVTVYRTRSWFVRYSSVGYAASSYGYFAWGSLDDSPIASDFDGDGRTDIAVYRRTTGYWFLRLSSQDYGVGAGNWVFQWGASGDQPKLGDFDGDGATDVTVYRPASGQWFIRYSSLAWNAAQFGYFAWGAGGDLALPQN